MIVVGCLVDILDMDGRMLFFLVLECGYSLIVVIFFEYGVDIEVMDSRFNMMVFMLVVVNGCD